MMRKILYRIMGGVVLLVIGLVLGLITGAFIGGNYLTEFEFGGVRGYEAVGNIGDIIGVAIGALFGVLLGVKMAEKKIPCVFRVILDILFIIFIIVAFLIATFFLISDRPGEKDNIKVTEINQAEEAQRSGIRELGPLVRYFEGGE